MKYMKDMYKDKPMLKAYETKEVSTLYDVDQLREQKQQLLNEIAKIDLLLTEADKLSL